MKNILSSNTSELSTEQRRVLLAQLLREKTKKSQLTSQAKCVHQLFEEQVEQTPNAVAVVVEHQQLTYRELNERANQLAHYLRSHGVASEQFVGLYIERSLEMVVGLLGILKAGGAYVPLDPNYPKEWLAFILADTQTQVLLSQKHLEERLPEHQANVICLDSDSDVITQQSKENPNNNAAPEALAYVTYSSRRGVLIEHRGINQRLDWLQNKFTLSSSDAVLHHASLAQDTAIWEIFWPLITGGRLVIATGENNPAQLQRLIATQTISLIHFVPSALSAFLESLDIDAASQLSSLRWVLCSGESLSRAVVDVFFKNFTCELHYLYSLPEADGEVTSQSCRVESDRNMLPLGHPTNKSIYVLDQYLQLVPTGITGEIYVGGTTLARGYLNAAEETTQRFINTPFSETSGTRLFKTGDLGRWLNDGTLELVGSSDRQTWIRGFRVELQEVEAALLTSPMVEDCRVLVRQTETFVPQLVAYMVLSGPFLPEQLQSHLQALLPAYMLPSAYVPLTMLPLTATGQVDEPALAGLAVIDTDLIQRWEENLQMLPEVEQVAVVVQEQAQSIPPLHLSDLLPDWKIVDAYESSSQIVSPALLRGIESDSSSKKLAISDGGPLQKETDAPTILSEALQRSALQMSAKGVIYIQSDGSEIVQSYRNLLEDAQRILAGLRNLGLKPQDKVIFQLERNQDFIPAFWGCVLGGFVPVPVPISATYEQPNSAISKLQSAWHMLGQPVVLAGAGLAPMLCSLSEILNLENFQVKTVDDLRKSQPDSSWYNSQPEEPALIVLTSGSTGMPKGVVLSHRNLLSRTVGSIQMNGFSSQDITLNWMPMDHVAGIIYFHIRDVYLGCQQIHTPTQLVLQDPLRWLDWIERFRVTVTFAPNFAFGLVNDRAEAINQRHWDLSSIRYVLNGAEAIVAKTARRFLEILAPHGLSATAMHPAWGMAEVSSGVTYSNRFSLDSITDNDSFVEVGTPIPGVSLRIVDSQSRVVEEDTVGSLQVKGFTLTSGYYQNSELNQEVFTDDGWFITGDLGFLHEGRLTIVGRAKDVIIVNGINYYSHEIESTVEELEGVEVSYTAAVAVRDASSNTDKLVIFFSPTLSDETNILKLIKAIRSTVVQNVGVNPDYLVPAEKEAIPKTSIGKIQRSQLGKRFQSGEFNHILKRFDLLSRNANTLPNWFYRRFWRQKDALTWGVPTQKGQSLVFLDRLGLGTVLCAELEQRNQTYISVEAGSEFAQLAPNCYRISPGNRDHYQDLLKSLVANGFYITQILHLWTYGEYTGEVANLETLEQAQEQGIYSLLYLVQALAQVQGTERSVRLQVISSHMQPVLSTDEMAYEKAPILGLIKAIPQEMPWLSCRHVDLPVGEAEANVPTILQELNVISGEREVAYRNGKRFVCRLERADLSQEDKQELPLKRGGMYLLSGGLGNIGVEIAKYLLQHYEARLLLVGRTPLPERDTWKNHLEETNTLSERIKAYQSLEQLGGEFIYQAVDVCNLAELRQVVEQGESQWGTKLDGVIHLAGIYQEHLLIDETRDSLAATLRPKVLGTWVLHQLLKNQPHSVFISFSSLASFFGGAMIGAYAAANGFLESISHYQRSKTSLQSYCLAWSTWEDMGVSRQSQMKGLTHLRGYYALTAKQGLHSLVAGLHHNQTHLLVGLDGSNPNIRRYVEMEASDIQQLIAYFTAGTNDLPISRMQSFVVRDRFGTQCSCDFVPLEKMPVTDTGAIDQAQLIALSNQTRRVSSERVAPRTETERQIANVWQQVLGVSQLSIYDNFFELGGSSLLAVQLISQLREVFGMELPLSALLEAQTVERLANLLDQQAASPGSPLVAIQPAGKKPPFFCIHPVGGNVLCYGDLARHLGPEQPFYALQSPGLNGDVEPLTRIEDMATHYLKAIQTIQPEGPYYLGGWSLGGIVAFEMAQQLHTSGQEVALLALIDSYAAVTTNIPEEIDQVMLVASVLKDLGGLSGKELPVSLEELQQLTPDEQLNYMCQQAKMAGILPPEFELEQIHQLLNVFKANHQAWCRYVPQQYPGRITLLYASEQLSQATQDQTQLWGNLAVEGIEMYKIPGDHYAIVRQPQVQVLGERLKAYLNI